MTKQKPSFKISTYYIQGMHCAACEILIEKRIFQEDSVEMVDVSLTKRTVTIEYQTDHKINPDFLNHIFKEDGYRFSSNPFSQKKYNASENLCDIPDEKPNPYLSLLIAVVFIFGYIFLSKTGLSSLISVSTKSSLPIFFLFGLLAGVSSCAALVGGIILSISKQWLSMYNHDDSTFKKAEPHLLFNIGRVLGYAGFGAILGLAGNFFKLSPIVSAILVIGISLVMILLGLQMIGVKALRNFQIRLPKSITGKVADESNFRGHFGPFLMGVLTFFLPCGFTITAQALALASGSPLQGALIMGLFALGTVPGLLAIGLSSVKFHSNPKLSRQFSLIAGLLVLFFAASNINSQLSVLGVSTISNLISAPTDTQNSPTKGELSPIVNGKQIIKMQVTSSGYSPNQFTIKVGTPVEWQITNDGTAGCDSSIVAQGLFSDRIDTIPNQTVTKEFTPTKAGVYRFSCTMGMYTGTITVVDVNGSAGAAAIIAQPVDSGAKGCGCGGGGGSTCGGSN